MNTSHGSRALMWRSAMDAALIMVVGMGFGRFAFTAVYPHLLQEGSITLSEGGWAASANYAGYLLGAILGIRAQACNAYRLCLQAVIGTAVCLLILAAVQSAIVLIVVRGIAGVFSALSMVAASLWLLEHKRNLQGAPLLYAGVGIGIALSAELLVFGTWAGLRSDGLWLLLGGMSLLIGLGAVSGLMKNSVDNFPLDSNPKGAQHPTVKPFPLVALYGLAGFGYIVTATYLPILVQRALPDFDSAHVWAVFGIGAAPSCFFWHRIQQTVGTRKALVLNLSIQAGGVVLPVFFPSAAGYLLSAFLVGSTFMGTVTIAMPAAQHIGRATKKGFMAKMTVFYSIGQIVGPIVANALYAYSQSFSLSLIAAGTTLIAGALISLFAL